ncbi:glycosyltransferase family 2 protein [Candidatus Woesearchaeota archaeon]|nr:glycosyltransferase family 2 protein [Candidatus Woesearchaeota archaeon]
MKVSILIPAYNEEATIRELISRVQAVDLRLLGFTKELIVIDDGSKDRTVSLVKTIPGVRLVVHKKNRGKGAAIRTGIKYATGDVVLIQDADLEYNPQEYPVLLKPFLERRTKVVYGSRFLSQIQKQKNIQFLQSKKMIKAKHDNAYTLAYFGGRFLTFLTNLLYNAKITDEATGYKVFDAKVLKSIPLKCTKFEFCPEVTAKVRKRGYRIKEVPISYKPRTFEEGKKIRWKDGIHAIWTLLKYRFVN